MDYIMQIKEISKIWEDYQQIEWNIE